MIRHLFFALVALSLSQAAVALDPVLMSGPTPAIANQYQVGDVANFTYTIKNNVPSSLPITVSGLADPVTRIPVANDCDINLPVGPATCQIGIQVQIQNKHAGQNYNQTLLVDYHSRTPLSKPIAFAVPPIAAHFIAVGEDKSHGRAPLLATSLDGIGQSWFIPHHANLPSQGSLLASSCAGLAEKAYCIAVGLDLTGSQPPLLIHSIDGGNQWQRPMIPGLTATGTFFASHCLAEGTNQACFASGYDKTGDQPPLIAQTLDNGATWTIPAILDKPKKGAFYGIACTHEPIPLCVAVGQDQSSEVNRFPLLAQSTDNGLTWARQPLPNVPMAGLLHKVSCTGQGAQALCVAVGGDFKGNTAPLIVQSTDHGATWTLAKIPELPAKGLLVAVSCTSANGSAHCVAVGSDMQNKNKPPLLVQTTDGGQTWHKKVMLGMPKHGIFNAVKCLANTNQTWCIAAGDSKNINPYPLLAQSQDNGATWSKVNIVNSPSQINFKGLNCMNTGANSICLALGQAQIDSQPPIIVQTNDNGTTWTAMPIADNPLTGRYANTGVSMDANA